MHAFKLVSTTSDHAAVEFLGANPAAALKEIKRTELAEADLWQDEAYLFTLRRQSDNDDFWIIFRREPPGGQTT